MADARIRLAIDGVSTVVGGLGQVNSRMSDVSRTADMVRTALGAIGFGAGLSQVSQMSDQYAKFTAQLKLATQSTREYAIAYADVKRIATTAQADLQSTGVLYARIANGTRELGLAQMQVANITETVNLALKVSGATAEESASAMLQLSQSFASGTLRGEEFNAVNEAAPRLMQALADGIGVPVGALKQMATEGKITSAIMADVLPQALGKLREEARSIETIGGALTVLKSNLMELVGMQANASGAVAALTGTIGALANNLALVSGSIATLLAAKVGAWAAAWIAGTYASITANQALLASNLATANSQVVAAGAASTLAAARVIELRAAVAAASGAVALAITTNGLIPAQARATIAAEAHAAALVAQTTAMGAASVAGGVLRAALAFLGGPVGLIITALGLAATAWAVWGKSSEDANKKALDSTVATGAEILASLEKQNQKLRERVVLAKAGNVDAAKVGGANTEKLASTLKEINDIKAKGAAITSIDKITLIELQGTYDGISNALKTNKELTGEIAAIGEKSKASEWMLKYATNAEKLAVELALAKKEMGAAFSPEIEARIRAQYKAKDAGAKQTAAAAKKEAGAYAALITTIGEKIAAGKLEMSGYDQLSESQKLTIKLDEAIKSGKKDLLPVHIARAKAMIAEVAVQDAVNASNKRARDGAADMNRIFKEHSDAVAKSIADATQEADQNELLVRTFGMTKSAIEQMELARLEEQLAQRSSIGMTLDEVDALKALIEQKRRSAGASGKVETKQAGADQSKRLGVDMPGFDKVEDPFKDFGATLRATFDSAGDGLQKMADSMSALSVAGKNYEKEMQVIADLRATKDPGNMATALKNEQKLIEKTADVQLGAYGTMAGAAKSYFDQKSDAYRLLNGLETAMHMFQMANMAEQLFTSLLMTTTKTTAEVAGQGVVIGATVAAEGVKNTAKIPGVFMSFMSSMGPWGAAAAAVAIAAVLGGMGGGKAPSVTMDDFAAQKANDGTGTVLGDPSGQSESIKNSLDNLEKYAKPSLLYTSQMVGLLRSINTSLSGATNSLLSSGFDAFGSSFQGSSSAKGAGIIGSIFGKSSSSTSLSDLGLAFANQTIEAAMQSIALQKYQVTRTDKSSSGFLGFGGKSSTSYSTSMSSVDDKVSTAMAQAVQQMYAVVAMAGNQLGISTAQIESLKALDTGLGKISLLGKTGQEIEELLGAVFGAMGDKMAAVAMPGILAMQKAGEGALETMSRVANQLYITNDWMRTFGRTLYSLSLDGARSADRLSEAFGGLEKLNELSGQYFESYYDDSERAANSLRAIGEVMASVNLILPGSKAELRDMASAIDLTSDSGRKAYATLLSLAPEFSDTMEMIGDLAAEASEKLMEAFTGRGRLLPALNTTSLKMLMLSNTLVGTYIAAGNISTLFLDVNSGLITFGSSTAGLTGRLTDAQIAGALLTDEIGDLSLAASGTVIDIAGLTAALANVNTDTFVATMGLVFDNLAERISGVIDGIGGERIAVREAALQIINPTVMSKAAIQAQLGTINTALPSNAGVVNAGAAMAAASARQSTLDGAKRAVDVKYGSMLDAQLATANSARAASASSLSTFQGLLATYQKAGNYNTTAENFDAGVKFRAGGYYTSGGQTAQNNSAYAAYSSQFNAARAAQAAYVKSSSEYAAQMLAVTSQQPAITAAAAAAAASAKAAQLAYASALQDFTIDASKSLGKLSRLREETVKYYDAQKQLADLMGNSAAGLRSAVADYRYSQLSDEQQLGKLQSDYAGAYAMGLSTTGETLAGYGDKLNTMLNPLLEKARSVMSDSAYNAFAQTTLARADVIAGRLEALTPTDYAADSLAMLGQIDATLVALDSASKSAEKIISDAINAGSDKTAAGLHAVIAALTGQVIPGFATGGDHPGGWRIVGENGPELEATGASRIFNASQTRSMFSGGGSNTARLEALVERQAQELSNIRTELRAIAASNAKMARLADRQDSDGVLVRNDADTPLITVAA